MAQYKLAEILAGYMLQIVKDRMGRPLYICPGCRKKQYWMHEQYPPPPEARRVWYIYVSLKKKLPIFINIAEGKT